MKTMVITGGTSGLGEATVVELLGKRWQIVILARNGNRAKELSEGVNGNNLKFIQCDLLDPASLKNAVITVKKEVTQIDVLMNNAGAWFMDYCVTPEGNEYSFALNHLSHFFLTTQLLPILISSKSRVICVSSTGHRLGKLDFEDLAWTKRNYQPFGAYGVSKLANILFARELHRRYSDEGLTAYSLHPGVVGSNFGHSTGGIMSALFSIGKLFMINSKTGAKTQLHLATAAGIEKFSGEYWYKCKPKRTSKNGRDHDLALRLWEVSEKKVESWK